MGVGNHLMVTMYTIVGTNLLTAEIGRGQRGIKVDTKEIMAMRNIVHFNCINPFGCVRCDGKMLEHSIKEVIEETS
jgi:hypothetical protein